MFGFLASESQVPAVRVFAMAVLFAVNASLGACSSDGSTTSTLPKSDARAGASGAARDAGRDSPSGEASSKGGATGSGGVTGSGGGAASPGTDGSAGASGADGASGACSTDADCATRLLSTTPSSCAEGYCDPGTARCRFRAKDQDGDGHRAVQCVALDATPVETGDDCNDLDANVHPGAWDGPVDGSKADACDGTDEDCNGTVDDGVTSDGRSCFCAAGDTIKCAEDGGGHPITFPKLDANGNPLGACALGKKTCGADGKYGPCVGAIPPETVDRCDGQDENCNGSTDMADTIPPINQITFTFDGDNDNFADAAHPNEAKTTSCPGATPTTCPSYLDTAKFPCNPTVQWRTVALPLRDCNDNDAGVFPGAPEFCNGIDDDCNGTVDDSYAVDAVNWVFDYDGDNTGDINVPAVHGCQAPTSVPTDCANLAANSPAAYCTGLTGEGTPPTCPPPVCVPSMWKKSTVQSDCKDRPDEDNPIGGSKPALVHVGGTDLCNGHDYDCDGTPDTGCGCSPVGKTQACGSAANCNAGTQTCNQGGIWGTCSGGDPKPRADYCPDKDSDGYCVLTQCQTSLCPAAVPAGFKQKSLCFAQTDCNDDPAAKGASIHPGGSETCNGDGTDYNCNKIPNTPGAGDCACVAGKTGIACAPTGYVYPAGKKPGDALQGICKWGSQSCNPDGTLTPCTGGVSGFASEQCTNPSAADYDCNGVPSSTQCNCKNGDTTPCENVVNCNKGCLQTCINGQWGAPSIPAKPELTDCYPDADHDGTCGSGGPIAKCPPGTWGNDANAECSTDCVANDATRNWRRAPSCIGGVTTMDCDDGNASRRPFFTESDSTACAGGASWTYTPGPPNEKCGDNLDSDCDGNDSNGYALGVACSAGGGSCFQTGITVCASTGSTLPPVCNAVPLAADSTPIVSPRNGSFDNNCDGKVEEEYDVGTTNVKFWDATPVSGTNCAQGRYNPCASVPGCGSLGTYYAAAVCGSGSFVAATAPYVAPTGPVYGWSGQLPACGATFIVASCTGCTFNFTDTSQQQYCY